MRTIALALFLGATAWAAADTPLRVSGDRLFVALEINGTTVDGLLDSAAEMTLVDTRFAERLGLSPQGSETARGTGGTAEVRFAEHVDIRCAGVTLQDRTVAIIDLSDISERLVGEPVAVIVGRELFDSGRFFLDIESGRFGPASAVAEPAGVRLRLTDHRGIKQLPVRVDAHEEVLADFDLGNGSEVLIGREYAAAIGLLTADRIAGTRQGGGIGGSITRQLVVLESLAVGGVAFDQVLAAVDPTEMAPAANIGVSILRNFAMTIDFPENSLWLDERRATRKKE